MCFSKAPNIPTPAPVVPPQEAKQPGQAAANPVAMARKDATNSGVGAAGSTLLTGPSGIESASLNLGKSSLLGQ